MRKKYYQGKWRSRLWIVFNVLNICYYLKETISRAFVYINIYTILIFVFLYRFEIANSVFWATPAIIFWSFDQVEEVEFEFTAKRPRHCPFATCQLSQIFYLFFQYILLKTEKFFAQLGRVFCYFVSHCKLSFCHIGITFTEADNAPFGTNASI